MEQKKEAVYLINDERYLHLRENGADVGFATYNKVTGEPLESGQISEKNLPPDGRNAIPAARNWYLFELSDDDRKVIQQESVKILENIPQAGIGRRRIWEPETLPKDIRLINSHYDDLYRIPDGGVIQVDYPDGRSFTARVEHLDDYHFDMGGLGNVFHICQFAEVMERNRADFYPEIQTQDEQAAWELGGKGYLAIQSCEDGWDYTIYHSDYSVMDGGQLDAPELTIQEAREQILEAHHMEKGRRLLQDYDAVMSAAPIQGQIEKIKKRKLNYAAMRADGELPREEYQALCKQADDEVVRLEQELKALSPAPDPQTVSSDMKEIYDFLSQKVDVHGACLAPELIDQFVEVVTPIADYSYRWKLNTGCKKSKEERTDLMAVSEKPILTFTIDFETAKRYREANKMPHQFRRAAWTDLTVEVYL